MNNIKLYNLIFPSFLLFVFAPWLWIISLTGNFVIDSIIIIIISYIFFKKRKKDFYKETVFKVWALGFLADIIGLVYLMIVSLAFEGDYYQGTDIIKLIQSGIYLAVNHSPYDSIWSIAFLASGILISSIFIFLLNYRYSFNTDLFSKKQRIVASIVIAIFTAPYTLLLPKEMFV